MPAQKSASYGTLTIGNTEYVVIPKAEYLRLNDVPPGCVDAHSLTRQSIAEGVRQAREHAGLTQGELAAKMGKSQTMISQAESGNARVSERYVAAVLKACGLPKDWAGPGSPPPKRETQRSSAEVKSQISKLQKAEARSRARHGRGGSGGNVGGGG